MDATKEAISLWLERFRADLSEPERLEQALRFGEPNQIAEAFRQVRDPFLRSSQDPSPLVDVGSSQEDFVRVMPEGRYFEDGAGRPFTPIGYNHNPDWQKLMDSNPLVPREGLKEARKYNPNVTRNWFLHLAEHGVNLIRLMIETPPSGNLENPVGTFQPEAIRWLDHVVTFAREAGIRLMVTPYDTFWMNLKWETTTYSPHRGGPVNQKLDWYQKPELREAQKRRMRFLIDRYGNLGTIFAWELMNEADLWWGASPCQLQDWADEMIAYVREYELAKWGRNHLVTISTAEAMPKDELSEFAFQRDDLDFATTHLYIGASKAPKCPLAVVATEARGVRHALSEIADRRPYLDGENGPIDEWIKDPRLDDQVHHHQSWVHLASGGAGSSLRWPYRNPHHLTIGMLQTLLGMRAFCDAVDWRLLCSPVVPTKLALPRGIVGTSFATERAMIAFVARTDDSSDALLKAPTGYRLALAFNTYCGEFLPIERFMLPNGLRSSAYFLVSGVA